jgi:hypothetical protein
MSVYEETKTSYLTHIKDLNLSYELYASHRGDEVVSPK